MVLHNFIVFEGIDGAGTSTQLKLLKKRSDGDKFYLTTEPTDGPTGLFLRQMLGGKVTLDPRTAAHLFAADRVEHVWGKSASNGGIAEKCAQGKVVVSDRYLFSSLAYQSIDCGEELPECLNKIFPLPQLLFFFQIDPEISLSRIGGRGVREIYEKVDFLKKVEENYERIISDYEKRYPEMKVVRIDATQPIEKVSEIIAKEIEKLH